tara:strand:+ start:708 stop:1136 length:429 start_codon:yes stop_codon:yes gene_type:complete
MIEVITDESEKQIFLDWVCERTMIKADLIKDFAYLGFKENDEILAAVIFNDCDGNNIFIHLAIDNPKAVQRRYISLMFDYVFNQAKCNRVTGQCYDENEKIKRLMEGVGFKKEGVIRKLVEGEEGYKDAAIYGMLKEECIWV